MIEQFEIPKILKRALRQGGEFSELFEELSLSTTIQKENRQFQKILQGTDHGVGLRVVAGGKTAYAYTNEISEKKLLELADQISDSVRLGIFDRDISLKTSQANWHPSRAIDPGLISLKDKAARISEADQEAWETDPLLRQVTTAFRDQIREVRVANSLGYFSEERQVYLVFFVQAVAAEGEVVQTGYEPHGGTGGWECFDAASLGDIARLAAQRAVRMVKARPAPSGLMPVILAAEAGGTMVHEAVGHGLEADLAMEGLSVYQDKIGTRVGSELITVADDPTVPGKRGSFQFDDEGTPAKQNILIERGILKSYMNNRIYADKSGVAPTGNGRRESYQHRPIVRMSNTMILPGTSDPKQILQSVDKGFLVLRMGSGQVNTVNGDFVFEVSEGFLIENGKIGEAVRGATLTGNGPEVLASIDLVGNDLGYGMGTCGKDGQGVPVGDAQPTLRIPALTVGGVG